MSPISKKEIQFFSFYISGEIFSAFIDEFTNKFREFSKTRAWTIDPPTLFNKEEDEEDDFDLGGELKIYSAWSGKLSEEDDIKNYDDVKSIVDFLTEESFKYSAKIEFTLGGNDVGEISNGTLSDSLSLTLLEEWRKKLGKP
ncbi:hypothetical protein [Labrys neptuniae]